MVTRERIYYASLLAGLIFIVLGVRSFFHSDVPGVVLHFVLGIALFIAALLLGTGRA